jgi:hypothetical protein
MPSNLLKTMLVLSACALAARALAQPSSGGQQGSAQAPGAVNPGSFVGSWAHTEPATQNSSAMVAFLRISPNGAWQEKLEVAARGKLVATMIMSEGRCAPNGADSIVCQTLRSARSRNGVNWTPTRPIPPAVIQLRQNGIYVGGWLYHRSQ